MDGTPYLSVIIVNYYTGDEIVQCLDGLQYACKFNPEIIIVDNSNNHSDKKKLQINIPM